MAEDIPMSKLNLVTGTVKKLSLGGRSLQLDPDNDRLFWYILDPGVELPAVGDKVILHISGLSSLNVRKLEVTHAGKSAGVGGRKRSREASDPPAAVESS